MSVEAIMQQEATLLGQVIHPMIEHPQREVMKYRTPAQIIRFVIDQHPSGLQDYEIAERIGMNFGQFSRAANARAKPKQPVNMNIAFIGKLQRECRSRAISQWIELVTDGILEPESPESKVVPREPLQFHLEA